jgi:gamma-glutamylcyclotransferase (GGCT)/AIG2-like uncharacterized protein YtfP
VRQHLFVYGSLRRGARNSRAELLEQDASLLGAASIPGRLVDLGDYPGLVRPTRSEDRVQGEVYRIERPGLLQRIDEYEGCDGATGFRRVPATAVLESGEKLRAWVYLYEGPIPPGRIIASGDYLHSAPA